MKTIKVSWLTSLIFFWFPRCQQKRNTETILLLDAKSYTQKRDTSLMFQTGQLHTNDTYILNTYVWHLQIQFEKQTNKQKNT